MTRPTRSPSAATSGASSVPADAVARPVGATPDDDHLVALAAAVQAAAIGLGRTIATAESCTGGLLGHSLTEVPGSSAYYLGGVISYADDVKVSVLGVDHALIERHGAVSEAVAAAMAESVRERLAADLAAAVTGIAGPAGDTADKPVGLTYVAVAGPDGTAVRRYVWTGDRSANKRSSAEAVLKLLLERLPGPREPGQDA